MWFWKIFVIIFSLASIWLDHGDGAPYSYFGVGDIADNTDVQQPLLKSDSLKTPDGQVSEAKTTNNIPTRGLFYPDDMFFTHWVPNVISTENCSTDQPSVTTPSYSTSTGTLQTKYEDKSTKHQTTTLGQQKSTSADKISLIRQQTSTPRALSSSSREQTSALGMSSLSRGPKTSTFAGPSSPRIRKTSKFVAPSLPRRRKPSTIATTASLRHRKPTYSSTETTVEQTLDFDYFQNSQESR